MEEDKFNRVSPDATPGALAQDDDVAASAIGVQR